MKTGKTPDDFKRLAAKKGLLKEGVKAGEIVAWLKKDFDLGHGHAMAIYTVFKGKKEKSDPFGVGNAKHFTGAKAVWQPVFESLLKSLREFGEDITIAATDSYLSILRGNRKMAIVQIGVARMDVGIKLKGVAPTKRFETAGSWNSMMTHRVRITDKKQVTTSL